MHIESNSRLCMASAGTGYKQSLGADGPPGSYTDFDRADLFFVIGSNMADCHPILFLRMADRLKAGAKLIVVDPRRTATAEKADLFLQIKPGTDLALLNGLLHLLVENGDIDARFIAEHTEGWDGDAGVPRRLPAATGSPRSPGIAEADIRTAARDDRRRGGVDELLDDGAQPEHARHLEHQRDLQPAPGHRRDLPPRQRAVVADRPAQRDGRPRDGLHGAGSAGAALGARRPPTARSSRTQWGLPPGTIRADVGPGTIDMFEQMAAGDDQGVLDHLHQSRCHRGEPEDRHRRAARPPSSSSPRTPTATTATNRYADIVLPATLWAESDAVMVNSERNLTLLQQSIPPPAQARPDWQLICQVAAHMGFGEHFDYAVQRGGLRRDPPVLQPADRLRPARRQLRAAAARRRCSGPCPPDDDADRNPIRYLNDGVSQDLFVDADGHRPRLAFPTPSRRAVFHARPHMDARRAARRRLPVRAQHRPAAAPVAHHDQDRQGRQAQQARPAARSSRSIPSTPPRSASPTADRSSSTSRRGRAVLPAVVTDRVRPGNCFAPFHWNDEHGEYLTINAVTNDAVDPDSLQPEFKVCAVSLRPVKPVGSRRRRARPRPAYAALSDDEKIYLAAVFTGLGRPAGVPVLPARPVTRPAVGRRVLAGGTRAPTAAAAATGRAAGAVGVADRQRRGLRGPAGRPARRARSWSTWTTCRWRSWRRPATCWSSPARSATAARPTTAPASGIASSRARCARARRRAVRRARHRRPVLRQLLRPRQVARRHGSPSSVRRRCSTAPNARPTTTSRWTEWAERVTAVLGRRSSRGRQRPASTVATATTVAEPFTRAKPRLAPLCRNIVLTAPARRKRCASSASTSPSTTSATRSATRWGCTPRNDPAMVDAWLAATGLRGDDLGRGRRRRAEPARRADPRPTTSAGSRPNLLRFVAEHCRDRGRCEDAAAPTDKLDKWLVNRNGLDVVAGVRRPRRARAVAGGAGAADAAATTRSRRARWSARTRCS